MVDIGHQKWSRWTQRWFACDRTSIHDIMSACKKFREIQNWWQNKCWKLVSVSRRLYVEYMRIYTIKFKHMHVYFHIRMCAIAIVCDIKLTMMMMMMTMIIPLLQRYSKAMESASHPSLLCRNAIDFWQGHGFSHFSWSKNQEREFANMVPDTSWCVDSESAIDSSLALHLMPGQRPWSSGMDDIGHKKWPRWTQR